MAYISMHFVFKDAFVLCKNKKLNKKYYNETLTSIVSFSNEASWSLELIEFDISSLTLFLCFCCFCWLVIFVDQLHSHKEWQCCTKILLSIHWTACYYKLSSIINLVPLWTNDSFLNKLRIRFTINTIYFHWVLKYRHFQSYYFYSSINLNPQT